MPSRKTERLEHYIDSLISKGIFPGISIAVARRGELLIDLQFGWKSIHDERQLLGKNTLYDLASVTKPLITAFIAAYLRERGQLDPDLPVSHYWHHFPFPITTRQLLTHTGGMPAWFPFYLFEPPGLFPDCALSHLTGWMRPGRRVVYSCVGYIILYRLLEKISGSPLQELAKKILIEPLGLTHTFFRIPENVRAAAAPTEKGNEYEKKICQTIFPQESSRFNWRTSMIQGEAHDLNAHHFGGYTGNAGLFSTPRDLVRLTREFFPATASILSAPTLELFWTNQTPFSRAHRTIGFKLNSSFHTSGGKALENNAIGHNGFTGTSVWLEKDSGRQWILLSNRIHPQVGKINFDRIRRRLHKILKIRLEGI